MIRLHCASGFKTLIQFLKSPTIKSCRTPIFAFGKMLIPFAVGSSMIGTALAATSADSIAPANYVNVCDSLGRAYFYVPSMESCVRIGGELRVRQTFYQEGHSDNSAVINYDARSRTYFDAWKGSELGNIRTFAQLEGNSGPNPYVEFDKFYMRIGSLIVGKLESTTNMDYGSYVFNESGISYGPDNMVWQLRYNFRIGQDFYFTKAVEQPVGSFNYGDDLLKQDNRVPDITLSANYIKDWGKIEISGGAHMNQTKAIRSVRLIRGAIISGYEYVYGDDPVRFVYGGSPLSSGTSIVPAEYHQQEYSKLGFFASIGAEYNFTPSLRAGLTSSYADGALSRIGINFPSDSIFQNRRMVNSKGHNISAGISYDIIPDLKFNAHAGYNFSREGYDHNNRKVKSYLAGSSLDYRWLSGTILSVGGFYEENDLSKAGTQFLVDTDGKDRRINVITQIRQQF